MAMTSFALPNTHHDQDTEDSPVRCFQIEKPWHPATITIPYCHAMQELPLAATERTKVLEMLHGLHTGDEKHPCLNTPLLLHLAYGLAYTTGSALGNTPPSSETCLSAFLVPNQVGLTAGARAWSKHFHRSKPPTDEEVGCGKKESAFGWWGHPSGPVSVLNEKAIALFWKVMNSATWRNLHWLPHQTLVYEVRVPEGYGMRWSQNQGNHRGDKTSRWVFRGYVEPMMENGHEKGWRH